MVFSVSLVLRLIVRPQVFLTSLTESETSLSSPSLEDTSSAVVDDTVRTSRIKTEDGGYDGRVTPYRRHSKGLRLNI